MKVRVRSDLLSLDQRRVLNDLLVTRAKRSLAHQNIPAEDVCVQLSWNSEYGGYKLFVSFSVYCRWFKTNYHCDDTPDSIYNMISREWSVMWCDKRVTDKIYHISF